MKRMVLIRHGASAWNVENRFTGWTDVPLTDQGCQEARQAALLLKQEGFVFDVAFTSLLKRAIKTLWIVLEELDLMWLPVHQSWRLNERHYGALQGLNKAETAATYGDEQVQTWRRSFSVRPPALAMDDPRYPGNDHRYVDLDRRTLPTAESLHDTTMRFLPYWQDMIAPTIRSDKHVIVAAHGNSLRALVKYLEDVSDEAISDLNIPTGIPLIYELNDDLTPIRRYYLGDAATIDEAARAVAQQGQSHIPPTKGA